MAVIAIAAFFVVSSMSLSNRLDEGQPASSQHHPTQLMPQITLRITGDIDGFCLMVVLPSSTLPSSLPSRGSGDL